MNKKISLSNAVVALIYMIFLFAFSKIVYSESFNIGYPVKLNNTVLFKIYKPIGNFSPRQRALLAQKKIEQVSQDFSISIKSITTLQSPSFTDIIAADTIITTVTEDDANVYNISRDKLSRNYVFLIKNGVQEYRSDRSLSKIILGFIYSLLVTLLFILFVLFLYNYLPRVVYKITLWKDTLIQSVKVQNVMLFTADRIISFIFFLFRIFRFIIVFIAFYFYLSIVLSFFPWTFEISSQLIEYVYSAFRSIIQSFLAFLPNLITISVIIFMVIHLIKFLKFIAIELKKGKIHIVGFYKEWIDPTYRILYFFIIAFTLAIIFPYLPGSDSPAFQGASIFIGVLVSLGSTAAVANIISGIILTYTRALNKRDRIKIGDTIGDVEEKNLLVIRIRTVKNEIVSIPNSVVLTSHIINYTITAEDSGLILNTKVSISYNEKWEKIQELLISAALSTKDILNKPPPFVFQIQLSDFYVVYELNAYTDNPSSMQIIYSELHKNIINKFNEAGVEIMSPHFTSIRNGYRISIPDEYINKNYVEPNFNVTNEDIKEK